ncbi:TldD/PmbA family protein [Gudongella sp. DL1XJH-153]|uniref:TldD/PmbA family protein n=1 Tax=Gudongella sp. DL1XJH-153 TaxID=3409804 RepID=UPI003BB7674D
MINRNLVENVLDEALSYGGDFAEIFLEDKITSNIKLVEGEIRDSLSGRDYGIGIRILNGTNSIYGYTNDSSEKELISLTRRLSLSLRGKRAVNSKSFIKNNRSEYNPVQIKFADVKKNYKIDLLKKAYHAAKNYDQVISQVTTTYMEEEQNIIIANSDGLWSDDIRRRTRFAVSSAASFNGEIQLGYYAPGASMGYEFYDKIDVVEVGREASRIAKVMIYADQAPSGRMPVVIENGFGGVLFHEACGHALEASFVSKGTSAFGDKLGKMVASPLVTAIDDGKIANGWGTTNIDDEGTPTRENILIENGILKSYLVDKLNGRRMGLDSTGSARRQSYRFPPTSRMNNTFIVPGESTREELIESIDRGLYAKKLGGGSVNPATGDFNFSVMESYLIENGRITTPVRGATLVGNGIEVLKLIDGVGNNLKLEQGMCGASSGSIPVNVGQPAIRVSDITVGGRKGGA